MLSNSELLIRLLAAAALGSLVESRNVEGSDELVVLLSKVSSHDIASFPEKLKELNGVREVTIVRKGNERTGEAV